MTVNKMVAISGLNIWMLIKELDLNMVIYWLKLSGKTKIKADGMLAWTPK